MGLLGRAWKIGTTLMTLNSVYKSIKAADSGKIEMYDNLDPDMQAQFRKLFGDPYASVATPEMPEVKRKAMSNIDQVKMGV